MPKKKIRWEESLSSKVPFSWNVQPNCSVSDPLPLQVRLRAGGAAAPSLRSPGDHPDQRGRVSVQVGQLCWDCFCPALSHRKPHVVFRERWESSSNSLPLAWSEALQRFDNLLVSLDYLHADLCVVFAFATDLCLIHSSESFKKVDTGEFRLYSENKSKPRQGVFVLTWRDGDLKLRQSHDADILFLTH